MAGDIRNAAKKRLARMGVEKTAQAKRDAAGKVGRYGAGRKPKMSASTTRSRTQRRFGPR